MAHKRVLASDVAPWYRQHGKEVAEAEAILARQLADRKRHSEATGELEVVCSEVFSMISATSAARENQSVLLLGEAGSGKTHVVEWCVQKLQEATPSAVVMRARGSAYATDVECLRHLAAQVNDRLLNVPNRNASFEVGMEWMRNVLRGSFKQDTNVILVLDQFEYFCSRNRQTLLYNLFNLAEESGVRLSVVGTSVKLDVLDSLEKRIRSRFSMRHLHTFLPTTMEGLVKILMSKLRLPDTKHSSNRSLKASFIGEFHRNVETALYARRNEWRTHLELGRSPSWFLSRCLPVAAFLQDTPDEGAATPPKRRRMAGSMPSASGVEVHLRLLESLSQQEHVLLLALSRLQQRKKGTSLNLALHEIKLFHERTQHMTERFKDDLYCAAFSRLLQLRLVEVDGRKEGSGELARHARVKCLVQDLYMRLVAELSAEVGQDINPLRKLPSAIQTWAEGAHLQP